MLLTLARAKSSGISTGVIASSPARLPSSAEASNWSRFQLEISSSRLDSTEADWKERFNMTFRDLKHSARRLGAHPGIAACAILSMALGMGANTTIFSVIHASLLRQLPYPDADRRVIVFTRNLTSPNI